MDPIEMLMTAKRFSKPDAPIDFGFVYSDFSHLSSAEVFEGCEVTIDKDYKAIYIQANGYEVTVALGNTPDWTTTSTCGGFDGALKVYVNKEEDFGEEEALFTHTLPIIKENQTNE